MPAPTATKPAAGPKQGTPVQRRPFIAGTRAVDRAYFDESKTVSTTTQKYSVFDVPPSGFLSGVYLVLDVSCTGNSATVAFQGDAPWVAIQAVQLNDVQSQPIVGPFSGYDLYIINKYGGYAYNDDPKQDGEYFALTGSGATGGSFSLCLRLPLEMVSRDAIGTLPNKNNASTFKVETTLNTTANIYSTAPTAAGSARLRFMIYGWDDPSATDMKGNAVSQNPPAVQTTQYWQKQTYPLVAGSMNLRLQGIDSLVRNLVFILDAAGTRGATSDADWPDPLTLKYEGKEIMNRLARVWRKKITEDYGYGRAQGSTATAVVTPDTVGARDYGVYPLSWAKDFSGKVGQETRLSYLPASSATSLELSGTIGGSGAHTLTVLVNKIVPANGNPQLLSGR